MMSQKCILSSKKTLCFTRIGEIQKQDNLIAIYWYQQTRKFHLISEIFSLIIFSVINVFLMLK